MSSEKSVARAASSAAAGRPLRVLMFPCSYTWLNTGDIAMLQVTVSRLNVLWPNLSIQVPTRGAEQMAKHCPDLEPIPYGEWFSDHFLLGRVHRLLPASASRALVGAKRRVGGVYPWSERSAIRLKLSLQGRSEADFRRWVEATRDADMVVVSGAGGLSDTFPTFTVAVLRTLEAAIEKGKPTAMFSHGLGPLTREDLRSLARRVLPRVDLIALREKRAGRALLEELGVEAGRIIVTGDDGIEIAYRERVDRPGDGLGVNVRTGIAAGVKDEFIDTLRPVLADFVREKAAPLVPLPIAWQHDWDASNIARLSNGVGQLESPEPVLNTPQSICRQVRHCRAVVAGAYHAAVFALSQGIPVVALSASDYYMAKFRGLADMFGEGCEIVSVGEPNFDRRLGEALRNAWDAPLSLRKTLREAANSQIQESVRAYSRFGEIVARRSGLPASSTRVGSAPGANSMEIQPRGHS